MSVIRIGQVQVDLNAIAAAAPGEKLQAELLLAELLEQRQQNPLAFYQPNGPTYSAFHLARERLKAIQGGNRSGKTTTALVDDILQAAPRDLVPEHLQAFKQYECPFYARIMTPDMQRTMIPVVHAGLKQWMPKAMIPKGWDKHYDRNANSLHMECGCRFDFLSYEMAMDKFGGAPMHRCHYDEEPPEQIRNECLVRLMDWNGDEMFSFTPLKGLTWSYRRIFKNRHDPSIAMFRVSSRENPNLSSEAVQRILGGSASGLDERQASMRGEGHYMPDIGFVYPHVREWLTAPPSVGTIRNADTIIAIDPGVTIAAITWTAWDGENFVVYDYRELKGQDVDGYVKEIRKVNAQWELREDRISVVVDPAATARSLTNAESVETELQRLGIYPEHGQNDIAMGVLMIQRLGRTGKFLIASNLESFIEVMEEYPLKENPDGSIVPAKTGREHGCDSVRYGVSVRAWPDDDVPSEQTIYPEGVAYPWVKPGPRLPGAAGDMV